MTSILVLGPGCPECSRLLANAEAAVRALDIQATVQAVADMASILAFDVLMTPALVVDGQIRTVGHVLSVEEIKCLLLSLTH